MKSLAIIAFSMLVTNSDPPMFVKGDMRIDKVVDGNVVCYIAQHYNGSSHTTPAIYCLKN